MNLAFNTASLNYWTLLATVIVPSAGRTVIVPSAGIAGAEWSLSESLFTHYDSEPCQVKYTIIYVALFIVCLVETASTRSCCHQPSAEHTAYRETIRFSDDQCSRCVGVLASVSMTWIQNKLKKDTIIKLMINDIMCPLSRSRVFLHAPLRRAWIIQSWRIIYYSADNWNPTPPLAVR